MPPPARRRPRDRTPPGVETFQNGVIVPVRWAHNADERAALRSANGAHLGAERSATIVVLVAMGLLVLLGVVRMVLS